MIRTWDTSGGTGGRESGVGSRARRQLPIANLKFAFGNWQFAIERRYPGHSAQSEHLSPIVQKDPCAPNQFRADFPPPSIRPALTPFPTPPCSDPPRPKSHPSHSWNGHVWSIPTGLCPICTNWIPTGVGEKDEGVLRPVLAKDNWPCVVEAWLRPTFNLRVGPAGIRRPAPDRLPEEELKGLLNPQQIADFVLHLVAGGEG